MQGVQSISVWAGLGITSCSISNELSFEQILLTNRFSDSNPTAHRESSHDATFSLPRRSRFILGPKPPGFENPALVWGVFHWTPLCQERHLRRGAGSCGTRRAPGPSPGTRASKRSAGSAHRSHPWLEIASSQPAPRIGPGAPGWRIGLGTRFFRLIKRDRLDMA